MFGISEHFHVDRHILPDLRVIDIQMDHFRLLGVRIQIACDTVVETHADGDQHVAFVGLPVRSHIAMHTEHTFVQRKIGRQRRQAEDGRTGRNVILRQECFQLFFGAPQQDTLPDQAERFLRLIDQCSGSLDPVWVDIRFRLIAADKIDFLVFIIHQSYLGVFCQIKHDRSRTSCRSDIESSRNSPCNLFRFADLVSPFGDRLRDADHIDFLECIGSEQWRRNLSGYDHHRRAVHQRIGNAGDGVRRTGSRSDQRHSDSAGYAGISLCSMRRSLFVTHQNMFQFIFVVVQTIVNRDCLSAGITEDRIYPFSYQRLQQSLRTGYFMFLHTLY